MDDEERKALVDFDELSHSGDMQEFINLHRHYCHYVAIDAHVKCLYLLLNDFYDSPTDDQYLFLNKIYENRDLMEGNK